jgi:hypothetical protein
LLRATRAIGAAGSKVPPQRVTWTVFFEKIETVPKRGLIGWPYLIVDHVKLSGGGCGKEHICGEGTGLAPNPDGPYFERSTLSAVCRKRNNSGPSLDIF